MRRLAHVALAFVLFAPATTAQAQGLPGASIGVSASTASLERTGDATPMHGVLVGASGRISFGTVALELAYAQGTLSREGTAGGSEDVVDGEAMLVVSLRRWLSFAAGTHLRAIVTPAGTERWVRHELRARTETDLIPEMMAVDIEALVALAADVNRAGSDHAARGATIGVSLAVADAPLRLRLAYAVDRASSDDAAEILQAVTLSATLGRR